MVRLSSSFRAPHLGVCSFVVLLVQACGVLARPTQIRVDATSVSTRKWNTIDGKPTRLIAHRGESAFSLPEHTLPSYHMAVWEHADYIEPDLVLTKDGQLVLYHDLTIKSSSDVAEHPEFADRMRNGTFSDPNGSGGNVTITNDWFIHDFTLAELKTLKLKVVGGGPKETSMRTPFFDGLFTIPTFQEYLDLIHADASKLGRGIGIIPEIKHPEWHNAHYPSDPHHMEDALLAALEANGYLQRRGGKLKTTTRPLRGFVGVQSFEAEAAKYIRKRSDVYIVQLVYAGAEMLTPKGLNEVAKYATSLGLWKDVYIYGTKETLTRELGAPLPAEVDKLIKKNGGLIAPADLSEEIKKRGLEQTPYTFYSSYELPRTKDTTMTPLQNRKHELAYFMALGIDGLFVENVAEAVAARDEFAYCLNHPDMRAAGELCQGAVNIRSAQGKRQLEVMRLRLVNRY
ncbi:PLC-like phosphodiesterase [Powellomyces hirtus]|nr:PLC-like phosphodiesterase [Powellomyces hirtus]